MTPSGVPRFTSVSPILSVHGLRDFSIEDESGNRLDFGEPIEDLDVREDTAVR